MALGEACGLQSKITSVPARTFSTLLKELLEKLGGDAAQERENSDSRKLLMPRWEKNSEAQQHNSLQPLQ